jgi:hypothetical protein
MKKDTETKVYVVEGKDTNFLKPTEIIAPNEKMAVKIYKQLYIDEMIAVDDNFFEARIANVSKLEKN